MAPPPPKDEDSNPSSSSPQPPPCRACVGATFFSRAAADAGKPATCAGLSRRLAADLEVEPASLPEDVHGDFSFICVGYSVYPDEGGAKAGDKRAAAGGTTSGAATAAEDVALPQCLGVQIIRAQAVRPTPLPAASASPSSPSGRAEAEARPPSSRPPRRRAGGEASPSSPAADALAGVPDLAAKVGRNARRVAEKMGQNALAGAAAVKKAAESVVESVVPGSGGRGRS